VKPPRSILVVVTRRIGDVLLATPVIRTLRRAWPDAAIDVLVFAGTEGVLQANRDVRRMLTIAERPPLFAHLAYAARLWRVYDLALSLVPSDRPTVYAWLAGRTSIGLVADGAKQRWKQRLLDRWVAFDDRGTHTVNLYLRVAAALGLKPWREVIASWGDDDAHGAHSKLAAAGVSGAYAVLHVSPKFNYKKWTVEGWRDCGRWLEQQGLHVVLTGGPDATERAYVAQLARTLPAAANLAGSLTLSETAVAVSHARIYIGPDTVVTHLAAALGVPVVALYGPTDPVKWGPWPARFMHDTNPWRRHGTQRVNNVILLQGGGACVPCLLEGCDRHIDSYSDCLQQLSARQVIAAAATLLDSTVTHPSGFDSPAR
jgi:heptosyltransferase-3